MLMTWIPWSIAFWATGVNGSPSFGSTTSTSGLDWISVSIWSACSADVVALSLTVMSMPSFLASAFALSDRALSQPWSAAGALNATLTSDAPLLAACSWFAVAVGVAAFSLLSSPHAATPAESARAANTTGSAPFRDMLLLLLIDYYPPVGASSVDAGSARRRG